MAIHESCHLICVLGGKGGVGKSVFATNLAFAFLKEMRAQTLLMDVDSKSAGDLSVITGVRSTKTLNDLSNFTGAINSQNIKNLISSHSSGLGIISAVSGPDQLLDASPSIIKKHLYSISQQYKFIIADLGNEVNELQMVMIELASSVVVVTTPEVLAVNQTKRTMNELMSATIPGELFHIVINKASRNSLNPKSIAMNLRRPVVGVVPLDDNAAYQALQSSTPFVVGHPNSPLANSYHEVVRKLSGGIIQKLKSLNRPKGLGGRNSRGETNAIDLQTQNQKGRVGKATTLDTETILKMQIHSELIKEMDLKKDLTNSEGNPQKEKELRDKTLRVISQLTDKLGHGLSRDRRSVVIKEVLDEALGLGPLEALLEDPSVTEIMVNGCDHIYAEKNGKLTLTDVTFTSNLQLRNVIERIVTPLGRRIDEKTPYVDARLADGSRVNAVIEPLAIDGPAVTIRKFPTDRITIDDYVHRFRSMTKPMADFLRICVEQGLNIIISGGTGSGKTTLLNVMSGFIPINERIVTVEDAAELQLKQEHVVRLETRPPNMEGTGEISIRDLVRNSLRMRPDRIVVGECRDGAALDMLAAMNTGHDGSMTTVHSNNPREAVSRLETLCMMAGMDLPAKALREQIAGAVDLIVQVSRMSDGSRKITSITEVVGMQGDTVTLQEVFRYKEEGFDKNRKIVGQYQAMGLIPTFIERFEQRGVTIPRDLFTTSAPSSNQGPSQQPQGPRRPTARIKPRPRPNPHTAKKKISGEDS